MESGKCLQGRMETLPVNPSGAQVESTIYSSYALIRKTLASGPSRSPPLLPEAVYQKAGTSRASYYIVSQRFKVRSAVQTSS
jgi:hypothetical protein